MNDRTCNIVGHIDKIKDAIVHGRKFDSQEAVYWLCHAADMIEQMDSRIVGMERCLRNQCSECIESRKAWDRWEWRGVCAENEHD